MLSNIYDAGVGNIVNNRVESPLKALRNFKKFNDKKVTTLLTHLF